jgi:hypothetical protein
VTIPFPIPIGGRDAITLPSWQLMIALAVLVIGIVVGAGLTLGIVVLLIARFVSRTTSSPDYQQNTTALQKRQNDRIVKMREARPTSAASQSTWRRWSVLTTAAIILMFVAFSTLLFSQTLFPSGQIVRQSAIVNVGGIMMLVALGIALLLMILWLRADRIEAVNRGDSLAIPWDFIAVVVTGLLVVGLGIGVIALINAP